MTRYNDRIELLYDQKNPSQKVSEYQNWLDKHKEELYITKILESKGLRNLHCQMNVRRFNSVDILEFVEWMEEVNKLIGDRTEGLLHQITETAVPLQNSAHA